jgi:hypothetical protein
LVTPGLVIAWDFVFAAQVESDALESVWRAWDADASVSFERRDLLEGWLEAVAAAHVLSVLRTTSEIGRRWCVGGIVAGISGDLVVGWMGRRKTIWTALSFLNTVKCRGNSCANRIGSSWSCNVVLVVGVSARTSRISLLVGSVSGWHASWDVVDGIKGFTEVVPVLWGRYDLHVWAGWWRWQERRSDGKGWWHWSIGSWNLDFKTLFHGSEELLNWLASLWNSDVSLVALGTSVSSESSGFVAESKLDVGSKSPTNSAETATVHMSSNGVVASVAAESVFGEIDKGLFDEGVVGGSVAVWRGVWNRELVVWRARWKTRRGEWRRHVHRHGWSPLGEGWDFPVITTRHCGLFVSDGNLDGRQLEDFSWRKLL